MAACAPPDLPEPLAYVLAAHWGEQILATFTAAAAFPTRKDAGDTLNVHRSSLLRTIRNVETAVGEPVLTDHARTAPLRLTRTGRRLLQQAEQRRESPRRAGRAS
jgi:DNA-binding transcriptional LysR family regulator